MLTLEGKIRSLGRAFTTDSYKDVNHASRTKKYSGQPPAGLSTFLFDKISGYARSAARVIARFAITVAICARYSFEP